MLSTLTINHLPLTIPDLRISADRVSMTGLYVHVPFCDGKCPYCAFYSVRYEPALADQYLSLLPRELEGFKTLAPQTIYIGGGTPSMLSAPQLAKLCRLVRNSIVDSRLAEWTIEINPGSVDAEKAAILADAGVNRVSLGAQSFDDRVLQTLGRRHAAADTLKAFDILRAHGFENIGLDLIACVPGCTRATWRTTLRRAVALAPTHVSVYALTAEEGTRLHRAVEQGATRLLLEDTQLAMLDMAEHELTGAAFERYEISNYARRGFECRHNLACWRGERYAGIGPAAASHVGLKRWTNRADLQAYLAALADSRIPPRDEEVLSPALKRQEQVIFGLRMAEGVPDALAAGYRRGLNALRSRGLVSLAHNHWVLTARGRNLADYVAVELMQ